MWVYEFIPIKTAEMENYYPAMMQRKFDGTVCEPRKDWGPTGLPALLG